MASVEAHAIRVYGYAKARGWKVGVHETADALGLSNQTVKKVIDHKGWRGRFLGREAAIAKHAEQVGPQHHLRTVDAFMRHNAGQLDS